jgi:hypothetical protein
MTTDARKKSAAGDESAPGQVLFETTIGVKPSSTMLLKAGRKTTAFNNVIDAG